MMLNLSSRLAARLAPRLVVVAAAACLVPVPVLAQQAAPAAAPAAAAAPELSAEQVQQLVTTLRQRNDQVRTLTERVRELEVGAARAQELETQLAHARTAITVASDKNRSLQAIGEEVITSYERLDLGKRTLAGEPFTQLYRVRMENELQDYRDKLAQLGFYPERDVPAAPAAAAAGN